MNLKSFVVALLLSVSFASSVSFANDKTPGSGPNPFSDCGIGAALFPNTEWAAVISNVIWDIGTTAVTSATASPESCKGNAVETAMFIDRTYNELMEETAQGDGQHVSAMLELMQCPVASHRAATLSIRESMGLVVSSPNYSMMSHLEKASTYFDIMAAATAKSC